MYVFRKIYEYRETQSFFDGLKSEGVVLGGLCVCMFVYGLISIIKKDFM